jgi:hypothetical protein
VVEKEKEAVVKKFESMKNSLEHLKSITKSSAGKTG